MNTRSLTDTPKMMYRSTVSVYLIPWTSELETRITDDMVAEYNANVSSVSAVESQSIAASFSVTRAEAIQRAEDMCWVSWRYDASTMHTPTTSTTTSPINLGSISVTISGISYCWGGMNGIDTAIYPNHHTFMVKTAYFSESSGFYMLTTYESTTDGSTQCAKTHSRDYPDVCNQYTLYTY